MTSSTGKGKVKPTADPGNKAEELEAMLEREREALTEMLGSSKLPRF